MEKTKKILFVHTALAIDGGGTMVAAWMLEGLKKDYEITLLTWAPVDLAAINRFYGTDISPSDFMKIIIPPAWLKAIVDKVPNDPWRYQRFNVLIRWAKMIRTRYDILVSASNEIDFGIRGIQYIHYPYQHLSWEKERAVSRKDSRFGYILNVLKNRLRPGRLISGFSFEQMRRNLTLVNSDWTGRKFKKMYNAGNVTVYPPVPGGFPHVPWDKRETGFVCIGRITNEKRYEEIIDIMVAVRKHFPEIHLHIVGIAVEYDRAYYNKIQKKIDEQASWIFTHEDIPRSSLVELVSKHRYGIHGMIGEHFGIAVGDMVCGGCIVLTHNSGGQVEIVNNNPHLLYNTRQEAVEKILYLLNHPRVQESVRRSLQTHKSEFTTDKFMGRIQKIVNNF